MRVEWTDRISWTLGIVVNAQIFALVSISFDGDRISTNTTG